MKKLSILALALSILSASCTKEAGEMGSGRAKAGEIRVSATVSDATKASTVGATTTFVDKDMLSLYVWTGSNTAVPEAPWINGEVNTYDGANSKWVPTHQMRWQNIHDAHYFLGVYPAKAITNFTTDPFTLDPTTAAYEANDLLVATILGDGVKAENDFVTNTVPLTFDHLMAKLNLTIRFRDQWGGIPSSVTVTVKAATTGTINYLSKTITPGETKTLQPFNWEANALGAPTSYYTSLMIPQTFQEVNVTVGGQTYTYTHSTAISLAAGTVTTLPLVVGKDFIALDDTGITVGDWTTTAIPEDMKPESTALSGLNRPLTIRAIADDTKVSFVNRSGGIVYYITSYGVANIIGKSETAEISLNKGQNVRFLGDNASYGAAAKDQSSYFHFTKECYVYGNVMSLVDSRNYATATTLTEDYAFAHLFDDCNAHIFNYAYDSIYLPATTLTKGCYQSMFERCYTLTEVTILAPDISTATDCVKDWLTGVQGWEQDFQLVTPIPFAWKIGETLPEGSTVYTPVDDPEGGRTRIYKAPKCKFGLIYNTSAQELLVAGIPYVDGVSFEYSSDGTTWSSTVPSATNAGNYNVYCRVKDGGVTSKALAVSIAKAAPTYTAPTKKNNLTYNGSSQALVNTGSATGGTMQYKLGSGSWSTSVPSQTNAGSYTVSWKVVGDANHTDVNETSLGSISIAKKAPTFNLSTTSVSFANTEKVNATKEVTITYDGDGTLSVSSSNTGKVTASVNQSTKKITLTRKDGGAASGITITVSAAAGTNYSAPANKTISVSMAATDGHLLKDAAVGYAVASNGLAYADKNNIPDGASIIGMVAYKNGNNGLIMEKDWAGSKAYYKDEINQPAADNSSHAFGSAKLCTTSTSKTTLYWFVGTKANYESCGLTNQAGFNSVNTKRLNAGCEDLNSGRTYGTSDGWEFYGGTSTFWYNYWSNGSHTITLLISF